MILNFEPLLKLSINQSIQLKKIMIYESLKEHRRFYPYEDIYIIIEDLQTNYHDASWKVKNNNLLTAGTVSKYNYNYDCTKWMYIIIDGLVLSNSTDDVIQMIIFHELRHIEQYLFNLWNINNIDASSHSHNNHSDYEISPWEVDATYFSNPEKWMENIDNPSRTYQEMFNE